MTKDDRDNATLVVTVRSFVNTHEAREGQDRIGSAEDLVGWLSEAGLLGTDDAATPVRPPDLALAHDLRSVLRARLQHGDPPGRSSRAGAVESAGTASAGGVAGPPGRRSAHPRGTAADGQLDRVSRELPLRVDLQPEGRPSLVPAVDGIRAGLARVLAAVAALSPDEWARLKVCPAGDCQWVFYDESRNSSRRWCSMEGCGNRSKVRSYRERAR
ncbi:MAG: CGNR zinc finger domain-containing protein [Acidimicrobiales bacterium]